MQIEYWVSLIEILNIYNWLYIVFGSVVCSCLFKISMCPFFLLDNCLFWRKNMTTDMEVRMTYVSWYSIVSHIFFGYISNSQTVSLAINPKWMYKINALSTWGDFKVNGTKLNNTRVRFLVEILLVRRNFVVFCVISSSSMPHIALGRAQMVKTHPQPYLSWAFEHVWNSLFLDWRVVFNYNLSRKYR